MQRAYISKLLEIADKDNRVMHVVADSGTGFDEMFRHNFPQQMINFGIAEENMVAAAAGMAVVGMIPFVYTAGAFLAFRSNEFIRDDVCFQNLNVKLVGMGTGLAWSTLGPTHHTTEDISVLRAFPNLQLLSPATPLQVSACVQYAYAHKGPVYIRIGMNNEAEFFDEKYQLNLSGDVLRGEGNVTIFSTGAILSEVMKAADKLKNEKGMNCKVVNLCCLKPLDEKKLFCLLSQSEYAFTVEEHQVCGGLGSMLSELLAESGISIPFKRIGLHDRFASGFHVSQSQIQHENGLDAQAIYNAVWERVNA